MEENHSVWVGSLSLSAKEDILSDLFGKFGPVKNVVIIRDEHGKSKQFGYVSYYNREVAECAAHVMDGFKVLNQAIKTKGPSELQKLKAENKVVHSVGKKDYRIFTDCLFFIDGRDCTWKSGECPFRHCQKAKETENVCEKWLERQCEDSECHSRHPRLTKNGSMISDPSTFNRCPSHNAFKCFGECGYQDCNTHFLEQLAYLEHVRMAKKKLAYPVSTCMKCQAVFFSGPEKFNHRCYKNVVQQCRSEVQHFTTTRVQAEKDITHPVPTHPNKSLLTSASKNFIEEVMYVQPGKETRVPLISSAQDCSNLQTNHLPAMCNVLERTNISTGAPPKNLEFSTVSCFDGSPGGTSVPCRRTQTPCTTANQKLCKNPEPVGVFWDFENCPVPKGKSALAIVRKLRSVFFKERREVEFMCVCDISKEKKAVIEELNKAQVTVVHINATSKNAADDKLRQSLRRFAQTYCSPATVILVSGDGNFAVELSDLRHRHNYQIICLHNVAASPTLLGFAHESHRFDLFTKDIEVYTPMEVPCQPSHSTDVLITNLPGTKSVAYLKSKLTRLSDNCGGKVLTVSGTKAIIRFPNSEAALRARRRLDKEELFGSILQAAMLPARDDKDLLTTKSTKNEEVGSEISKPSTTTTGAVAESSLDVQCFNIVSRKPGDESKNRVHCSVGNNFRHEKLRRQNSPQNGLNHLSRSPVLNHQFHSISGNAMYNGLFHTPVVQGMFPVSTGSSTPSVQNINSSILAPPGALGPMVNGVLRRSPSPDQQLAGVDLLVTNINETVSKKEIKKKLASVFREHCKVYSVVLHARNGAPLRAFVKVPKLLDAHLAISKVIGKTILGKVVHVSIASEKDKELCYVQDEVVVVLQDVPLNWLPLPTFLMNFEKKHRRCFDVRHLEQIRDVVVVNGSPGCQTIGLLEGKVDSELVTVDVASFASDVFKLLHHYEGVIQLASFPALYWLEFHKEIQPSSSGTLLAELLSSLPNVMVAGTGRAVPSRSIQWIRPIRGPCDASDLLRLSSELVDILQKDHEFEMTIGQLQVRYFSTFDKPLDASSYGFHSVYDLLLALPAVAEVVKTDQESCVSLAREHRVKVFAKEIEELLVKQKDNAVLLSNFMASYVKHFGQKFKVALFGFSRLTELIKAIPDVAEIDGVGDQRTVTLIHKKEEEYRLQHCVDNLTEELTELLNVATDNEISLNAVVQSYRDQHGRQLSLSHYGCENLDELLERLSDRFQIVLRGGEKFLQFCTNVSVDSVKKDLVVLLERQESNFIYVRAIPKAYQKLFHRRFPYKIPLQEEVVQSIIEHLKVRGNGNDQIVELVKEQETENDLEFLLAKTAVEILYGYPEYSLHKHKFLSFCQQKLRKHHVDIIRHEKLTESFPCCVVVRKHENEELVSLKRDYCIQILIEQLKELISSSADMSILVKELPTRFQDHFGVKLNLNTCGFRDISDLKEHLQGFIEDLSRSKHIFAPLYEHFSRAILDTHSEVTVLLLQIDCKSKMTFSDVFNPGNRLGLSPISRFQVETQSLLKNCDGCISLNRFAPAYQQMFSKPCIVADFGYSKLASLINAVPHVAKIMGNSAEKVVIAVEMTLPERVCKDLLSVRIINEDNSEVGQPREDAVTSSAGLGDGSQSIQQDKLEVEKLCSDLRLKNVAVSAWSRNNGISNESLTAMYDNEPSSGPPADHGRNRPWDERKQFKEASKRRLPGYNFTSELQSLSTSRPQAHDIYSNHSFGQDNQMMINDLTMAAKRNDNFTSTSRSAPQKVRLAANFMFPLSR